MIKKIRNLIILLLIIGLSYTGYIAFKGYQLYEATMTGVSIEAVIDEIRTRDNYTDIAELPSTFLDAIVAVEDHRFMDHKGFDLISFSRALLRNMIEKEYAAGGSTITQQLSKNLFFTFDKKMERKVAELIVAKQIEQLYEKDEILELYVNIIYFGDGYEGIYDASKGYFRKEPSQLDKAEALILAGLPQAPSAYALREHYDRALQRSLAVIDAMVTHGYITNGEGQILKDMMNNTKIQVY